MKVTGGISTRGGDPAKRPLPAPPVPPRPSKALVAEALARARALSQETTPRPIPQHPETPFNVIEESRIERTREHVNTSRDEHSRIEQRPRVALKEHVNISRDEQSRIIEQRPRVALKEHVNITRDEQSRIIEQRPRVALKEHVNMSRDEQSKIEPRPRVALNELVNTPRDEQLSRIERYDFTHPALNELVNTPRDEQLSRIERYESREEPHDNNSHYSSITPTTILMIDNSSPKPVSPTITRSAAIPLVQDLVTELRECSQLRSHNDHFDKHDNDYSLLTLAKKGIVKTCIQHSDWFQVEDSGHPIRYSSCQITLEDQPGVYSSTEQSPNLGIPFRNYQTQPNHTNSSKSPFYFNKRRERMASLQGLPPLPKSLSGMNLLEGAVLTSTPEVETPSRGTGRPVPPVPGARAGSSRGPQTTRQQPPQSPGPGVEGTSRPRKPTGLDAQLAVLRTEMFGLRQLDLSLLAQLWSLNESIQEFRQLLQEQDTLSPPSPSSADDGDDLYHYLTSVPEQYCLSTSSSQSSIEYGNV